MSLSIDDFEWRYDGEELAHDRSTWQWYNFGHCKYRDLQCSILIDPACRSEEEGSWVPIQARVSYQVEDGWMLINKHIAAPYVFVALNSTAIEARNKELRQIGVRIVNDLLTLIRKKNLI